MNRFRSSSARLPAVLLLLSAVACKGPASEEEGAPPPEYEFGYESDPGTEPLDEAEYDAEYDAGAAPPDEPEATEMPPPQEPDPEAAYVPPPTASADVTVAGESPDVARGIAASERLDARIRADAENREYTIERFAEEKEAAKPRVRDNYVFLLAGARSMADEAWEPVETITSGGINYMGKGPGGIFHWDVAYSYGEERGNVDGPSGTTQVESTVWEIDAGIAKIFALGSVLRPYIGVGVTYMRAGGLVSSGTGFVDDSDNTFGGYARAGLALDITSWGGLLGVDARYVAGTEITLGGIETDADGVVGSITLGFSW